MSGLLKVAKWGLIATSVAIVGYAAKLVANSPDPEDEACEGGFIQSAADEWEERTNELMNLSGVYTSENS